MCRMPAVPSQSGTATSTSSLQGNWPRTIASFPHPFKNPNTSSQAHPFLTSIFDSLSSNRLPSSPNPYRYPAICNFTALCQLQLQECPTANFPPLTHSCNSILKLQSTCIVPTRCASPGRRPNPRSNVLRHHQAPPRWGDYSEAPTSVC
jgi:hypothetical protein